MTRYCVFSGKKERERGKKKRKERKMSPQTSCTVCSMADLLLGNLHFGSIVTAML